MRTFCVMLIIDQLYLVSARCSAFQLVMRLLSFIIFMEQNPDQRHVSSDQDQSSMLKVICNQRDRFRVRLRETEEVCHFTLHNIAFVAFILFLCSGQERGLFFISVFFIWQLCILSLSLLDRLVIRLLVFPLSLLF